MKAVVLAVPDEIADDVARLVASTLSMNGYRHNEPSVIDWPAGHVDPEETGGKVGRRHPSTSRRAAAGVRRGTQLSALLAIVAGRGDVGVTCFEATEPLRRMLGRDDLSRNQVATRMGELAERGLVTRHRRPLGDEGEYVERQTEGENTGCVWFATSAGIAERERLRRVLPA